MAEDVQVNTCNEAEKPQHNSLLKQPIQFNFLFFIEFWERFGFYAINSLLVLYLTQHLGYDQAFSVTLMATFTALTYGFVALGGWLGDKILGTKRMITIGAIVLALGYALVTLSTLGTTLFLFLGLGTVAVGNGLFKSNPSSLLTTCYEKEDARLDGAFTLYYMSINIGSFLSTTISPLLANSFGWGAAFGIAIAGMILSLVTFFTGRKYFRGYGSEADNKPTPLLPLFLTLGGTVLAILICTTLLYFASLASLLIDIIVAIVFAIYLFCAFRLERGPRNKMLVGFVLIIDAIVFFVLYNQMSTSLTLFCNSSVDMQLLFITLQPAQFQSFNPLWIVIFSPLLAIVYNKLGDRFPLTYKFAIGMAFTALSFLVLWVGTLYLNDAGKVSAWWIVLSYVFQSVGELLISGLGLSMIAQMVPQNLMGFAMGTWFCASSAAAVLGGTLANIITVDSTLTDPFMISSLYGKGFLIVGIGTLAVSIIMLLMAGKLNQLTHTNTTCSSKNSE